MEEEKIRKVVGKVLEEMDFDGKRAFVEALFSGNKIAKELEERKSVDEIVLKIFEDLLHEWKEYKRRAEYIEDISKCVHEFASVWADERTPIYIDDVLRWYAVDHRRLDYANDAMREFFASASGAHIGQCLQLGIYICVRDIVVRVLENYERSIRKKDE